MICVCKIESVKPLYAVMLNMQRFCAVWDGWERSKKNILNKLNNFVKVGELEIHKIYPQALTVKGYISAVKEISRTLLDNEKMLTPLLSIIYGASGGYDEQKTMCVYLHGCDHQPTVNIRGNGEVDY